MSKKRPNETDEERRARKKAKKEKKLAKQAKKGAARLDGDGSTTEKKTDAVAATTDADVAFTSFTDAPFAPSIQKALVDAGFKEPSPIQARAWPAALQRKDLIAVAKTGSGKTLGFLLPVFHHISEDAKKQQSVQCLVLAPTRELVMQIQTECVKFGHNIPSECIYGGTSISAQLKNLRENNPQVIVATPGRLCDVIERKEIDLNECRYVVLDEADRMLDMGFEPQLKQIMAALPEKSKRQTLFFTATWPKAVRRAAASFLRKEEVMEIFIGDAGGELAANKAVTQTFVQAQDDEKDKKLYELLCSLDDKASVVVFCNTKRRVDFCANTFWHEGFTTCAVHGDKPQHDRDASLKAFINKQCSVMVATDVAARGLDIKGVTHVVNFDMARDVESYVHRIGRTGRAGELGEAVTFWNPDYDKDCSPALVKIAKDAGQEIPPFLAKYERAKASKQWKVADAAKASVMLLNKQG